MICFFHLLPFDDKRLQRRRILFEVHYYFLCHVYVEDEVFLLVINKNAVYREATKLTRPLYPYFLLHPYILPYPQAQDGDVVGMFNDDGIGWRHSHACQGCRV